MTNHFVWTKRNDWTPFGSNEVIGRATCLSVYLPPGSSQFVCFGGVTFKHGNAHLLCVSTNCCTQ